MVGTPVLSHPENLNLTPAIVPQEDGSLDRRWLVLQREWVSEGPLAQTPHSTLSLCVYYSPFRNIRSFLPSFNKYVVSSYCVPSPTLHRLQCRKSLHKNGMKEIKQAGESRGRMG